MKDNLISVEDARERILSVIKTNDSELTQVGKSLGRTLAEDVTAQGNQPPFANSSMDGFALRASDIQSASQSAPVTLQIVEDIPAGSSPKKRIEPGQAARIMTGAPLPEGADAVVPVEDARYNPEQIPTGQVSIFRVVQSGAYVRLPGEDFQQGQILLSRGRRLQPQDLGVIASIGQQTVHVYRRPRIALFSSGDELVPPGQSLGPGQIYDSNQYILAGLLEQVGAEIIRLGTARDNPQQVNKLLTQGIEAKPDLIVSSAGVSVGAFDFVRQVIESQGVLSFWRVNMRPGKPLAFGSIAGIPFVGLPGNPVSAYVGCRVFVLPAVEKMSGISQAHSWHRKAVLSQAIESDGRESYLRAVVSENNGIWHARLAGHQGSGNLFGLTQSNALLIVPSGVKSLPSGSQVNFWFLEV